MTKIQKNIAVANLVIDELHKDKPFVLKLDVEQTKVIHDIDSCSHGMNSSYIRNLTIATWHHIKSGCGCGLVIDGNADDLYHMLSSYIAKHSLPESVVESLKEVC